MQGPACDLLKKLEEAIKELNHLKYTVIERDYEMQNLHDLSYSRHYEQLQEELNAQILTQENLLIKKKKKTETRGNECTIEAGNSRLSRGPKDNMMIRLKMELAGLKAMIFIHQQISEDKIGRMKTNEKLEKIVSGLLFLHKSIINRRQNI